MSARNHSDSPRDGAGGSDVPVLQPGINELKPIPEIVWSSPVSTGSGLGTSSTRDKGKSNPVEEEAPGWSKRYIYAFESDLLDNAFVHWEQDALTLEMISGFKKDFVPANDTTYPAETVASGLGDLLSDGTDGPIHRLDSNWSDPALAARGGKPFQPDESSASPGPMKVRDDGIEDPVAGWRPTGMVFFETLATPPRGTVYSSNLLDSFKNDARRHKTDGQIDDLEAYARLSDLIPFFDFPDSISAIPADETEEFLLPSEVVVKGGGGGSGGASLVRLFGRMVVLTIVLVGLGFVIMGGAYAWYIKHRLYDGESRGTSMTMIVKPGDSFRSIIDEMHTQGLLGSFMGLDDRYLMRYLAYAFENSDKVKPGVYRFSTGQNLNDVYDNLITGSKDFKVTIPEGSTVREVGAIVAKQYKNFDANRFLQLVGDPAFIESVGVQAPSLEGYLYPSTYYFGPGMKEEELIKLMVSTFQGKVETMLKDKDTTVTGLSFQEHVIMASLIEREARLDEDRPLIASVIFNRLERGIPLQIDATVNYALNEWRRLTNADYRTEHPYNTYQIKGLPPGPIASPRIESLAATFNPPETNYLYYVHKGDGHHAFAETYAQHQANVGRYIRAKNISGMGNAPSPESLVAGESSESNAAELQRQSETASMEEVDTKEPSNEKAPALADDSAEGVGPADDEIIDIKIEAKPADNKSESAPNDTQAPADQGETEPAPSGPKSY